MCDKATGVESRGQETKQPSIEDQASHDDRESPAGRSGTATFVPTATAGSDPGVFGSRSLSVGRGIPRSSRDQRRLPTASGAVGHRSLNPSRRTASGNSKVGAEAAVRASAPTPESNPSGGRATKEVMIWHARSSC